MRHLRIIHRLRTGMAIVGFLAVAALVGLAAWANHTGLPEAWREGIAEALAKHGVHAEIASLRFVPLRGFEAGEVVIYSDASRQRVAGRLERLVFDLDRSRLSRGDFQIERLELSGARFALAVDPLDPSSESLEITDLTGQIEFAGPHSLHIQQASGRIHGVRLDCQCQLELYRTFGVTDPAQEDLARKQRRELLMNVIHTLDSFDFPAQRPPRIRLEVQGDLENPDTLRASVSLRATELLAREVLLHEVDLRGEMHGPLLVLHQGQIVADHGELSGHAEYDLWHARGRASFRSTLDIPALLRQLELPLPEGLPEFGAPPLVEAKAEFSRQDEGWQQRVIGHTTFYQPRWQGLEAREVSTAFAWDGAQLLLEDLQVAAGDGAFRGRIFIQPDQVRYAGSSTLPLELWQKGVPVEPLHSILNDFSKGAEFDYQADFHGHVNLRDHHDWSFVGEAAAKSLSFRGVPAREASVSLDLTGDRLDFRDGKVLFDYDDYPLKRRHGGADRGNAAMELIRYDAKKNLVLIDQLKGTAWPAPILRTFAPEIADELEAYGFHQPPELSAQGVIGIEEGLPKQDLSVRFASDAPMDYEFLGKRVKLESPQGRVRVLPHQIDVEGLNFETLGGSVRGALTSQLSEPPVLKGEIDWTALDLEQIASTYGFATQMPGRLTGRAEFSLKGQQVSTLEGAGHLAVEDALLFDVPVFGPLSPVIAAVLGSRKAGFQEASSAFFSFQVEKGVLHSQDFLTTTPSLVFTGDGQADLNAQTLDMTLRMNARGLFGVITLPLKPFYGLFQFRGTGPLQKPEWDNVMFTSPPEDQNERLISPPRALPVPEAPLPRKNPSRSR